MAIHWGPWADYYRIGIDVEVHGASATIKVMGVKPR